MKRCSLIILIAALACVPEGRESGRRTARTPPADPGTVAPPASTPPPANTPPPQSAPPNTPPPTAPPPTTPPPSGPTWVGLALDPLTASIAFGGTQAFRASALDSEGTRTDVSARATWSSSAPSVAVDAAGVARATGAGRATITARFEGLSAEASLEVSTAGLTAVELSPRTLSVPVGGSGQLTLTAIRADGSRENVTQQATWSASATNARVTLGRVEMLAAGAVTITAVYGGLSASVDLSASACSYPTGNLEVRLGSTAPNLVFAGAVDETGAARDFSFEQLHCGADYQRYSIAVVVVGTEWCPNCPEYFRYVSGRASAIQNAGGLVIYAEVEDRNYRAMDATRAAVALNRTIGTAPGLRVGDAPNRGIYRAPLVQSFPTAFVVRRRDMRVIADQTGRSRLNFEAIAADPERDWGAGTGQTPPSFRNNCGPTDEESYEPNDAAASAAAIMPGSFNGGICTDAPDFYRIDIAGNWTLELTFRHSVGDIDVYVWDEARGAPRTNAQGQKIGSDSNTDNERFDYSGPAVIQVLGYRSASAPYVLNLSQRP